MKRWIAYICTMLVFCVFLSIPASADAVKIVGFDNESSFGNGTEDNPYIYLIDEGTRVTAQRLRFCTEKSVYEQYQCRENKSPDGGVLYSLEFTDVALDELCGIYSPGIRLYETELLENLPQSGTVKYFSFVHKRRFNATVRVMMYVGDQFGIGESLVLGYYGGFNDAKICSSIPIVTENEIYNIKNPKIISKQMIVDENGFVTFEVKHGGNYYLAKHKQNFSGFAGFKAEHYESGTVLGRIRDIFRSYTVASAVARELRLETKDGITQASADSMISLYLASRNLTELYDLEKIYFEKMESLTVDDNAIEYWPRLYMPSLKQINASSNALVDVEDLEKLKSLVNINLSDNYITVMPDISAFKKLEKIDLSGNFIETLPAFVNKSIRKIDLRGNALLRIDADFTDCSELVDLLITNQSFTGQQQLYDGDFVLETKPEIITQYGNSIGTVVLTDAAGEECFSSTYKEFADAGFTVGREYMKEPGAYNLTIVGYYGAGSQEDTDSAEILGTYTYTVYVSNTEISIIKIILIAAAVLAAVATVIALIMARRK